MSVCDRVWHYAKSLGHHGQRVIPDFAPWTNRRVPAIHPWWCLGRFEPEVTNAVNLQYLEALKPCLQCLEMRNS